MEVDNPLDTVRRDAQYVRLHALANLPMPNATIELLTQLHNLRNANQKPEEISRWVMGVPISRNSRLCPVQPRAGRQAHPQRWLAPLVRVAPAAMPRMATRQDRDERRRHNGLRRAAAMRAVASM